VNPGGGTDPKGGGKKGKRGGEKKTRVAGGPLSLTWIFPLIGRVEETGRKGKEKGGEEMGRA